MVKLTGALIGCGTIAREHLAALAELNNVEVAAVCDLSAARAEATSERFNVTRWYTNYEQLIADIRPDLVHITTPPSAHFSLVKSCLSAGLNVLCEKPITPEYQQFAQLKQLATENHCLFMENQNFRFHSSVRRIHDLLNSGMLGDLLDVQICLSLRIVDLGSPYIDRNAPHYSLALRGGVVGDFLTHIAYLAFIFTGPIVDLRTVWKKVTDDSPLPFDEFRGFLNGNRATAYVAFSGNARPSGFWIRVTGSQMYAETNLFEAPRLTIRRFRPGVPALATFVDGIAESRDVMRGVVAGLWRKIGGSSGYDGLPELIARTYRAIELKEAQPVPLEEIDQVARLVDNFTDPEFKL